eukprot:TRINITY_DN5744_c0_g1_i1.p1 TRINITY_DN5744_c0_g1~~TRINITY_DN5744_c0_g1_i1.p1  ORF type:complete len:218 (+),score=11.93 TRINITY_DN5744_c0_g1_i1:57-710(+)
MNAKWEHLCIVEPSAQEEAFPEGVVSLMPERDGDMFLNIGDMDEVVWIRECKLQSNGILELMTEGDGFVLVDVGQLSPRLVLTNNTHSALLFAAVICRDKCIVGRLSFGVWKRETHNQRRSLLTEETTARSSIVSASLRHLAQLSSAASREPPTWAPDSSSLRCTECGTPFSFFLRRHHCRACGDVFCHACTARTHKLLHTTKAQRVCGVCCTALES